MPQRAAADDVVNAPIGSSGLTWSYTEATKTLTISNPSGTPEAMPNFSYQDGRKSPWAAISEKIETVTIEDRVTTIGTYAFDNCWALKTVNFPANGLTAIGYCAFMNCSALETITLPASVKTIGDQTFYGSGLTKIEVNAGNTHFTAKDGVLYNKGQTILICYPPKKLGTDFTVPSTVQTIDECALQNCEALKTVKLPDGLTTIERYAFQNCAALEKITLPASVTTIGNKAFDACSALEKITLPASVTTIGKSAFGNCTALTDVTVEWTS